MVELTVNPRFRFAEVAAMVTEPAVIFPPATAMPEKVTDVE